jgi:hypothetical protein
MDYSPLWYEKAPMRFGGFPVFWDCMLILFSVILELGAGHAGIHVLCSGAFYLMIYEHLHKTLRLVFDVIFTVPASASYPYCHSIFSSLFLL